MAATETELLAQAQHLLQAGNLDEAARLCQDILESADREPRTDSRENSRAQAYRLRGLVAYFQGRAGDALRHVESALELAPRDALAHDNRSLFLAALDRPVEAEQAARRALTLEPGLTNAAQNLGVALLAQFRCDEAERVLCDALATEPRNADLWNALGTAWYRLERFPEAAAALRRALELRPEFPLAVQNLRDVRARLRYRPAPAGEVSATSPAALNNNRGVQFLRERAYRDAEAAFRQALRLEPQLLPEASFNLARALEGQGRLAAAEALYLNVLRLRPAMTECHRFLGDLYFAQRRFTDAQASRQKYADAEQANPTAPRPLTQAEILNNLATDVLSVQGRQEEARSAYQQALVLAPEYAVIHSNALFNEHYAPAVSLRGLAESHAVFEARHATPLRSTWRPFAQSRDPDRRLRIGFVSGDLFFHPVGIFLAPMLERFTPDRWTTICYSNHRQTDFQTARLSKAAGLWRQVSERTDEALAEQIRDDKIDLLFDLSGHTGRNRLLTFARRPAPLQFTWMGYVGTTGLSAIDFLIADRFHTPQGCDAHYREKLLRLPAGYVCYEPPAYAPDVVPLPADAQRHITFGCFNNSRKITPRVVALWAEILRQVPDALLVLKCPGFDDAEVRARLTQFFDAESIVANRVEMQGTTSHQQQLAQYQRIDLALDTFPYSGGLTTLEACWMGVPVVTCPGETFASRHSLSHLSNIGATDTIARDPADYVARAVNLARNPPRLSALRAGLRERMARSPLCDLDGFAAQFTAALRRTWREWCTRPAWQNVDFPPEFR